MSKPASWRVLVVDDDATNRDLLCRRLERKRHRATSVASGREALEALGSSEPFDMVLLDIMMPQMSGLEVLAGIRAMFGKTELPVIMVTAKAESDDVVEALRAGANDYVTKPIDFPILFARMGAQMAILKAAASQRGATVTLDGICAGAVIDGRYEVVELIGEGGMAVVYRAMQLSTGQEVALKHLRASLLKKDNAAVQLGRFSREMRVISELRHPNIVRLLDSGQLGVGGATKDGEAAEVPYLVLELLHGEPLSDRFDREGRLSVVEAVDLIVPVLAALAAAHSRNVVHRDIKPHNVLLETTSDGHPLPKVVDFGIAKIVNPTASSLSEEDMVLGTPEYVAPEQIHGEPDVDARADQFSAAAVLYHALTGRPLYEADAMMDLLRKAARADYPAPAEVRPDLPRGIQTALSRALAPDRAERYSSVAAFGHALLSFASARISDGYVDELEAHIARERGTVR